MKLHINGEGCYLIGVSPTSGREIAKAITVPWLLSSAGFVIAIIVIKSVNAKLNSYFATP